MPTGTRGMCPEEKILTNVIIRFDTGCWEWQRSLGSNGYGRIVYNRKEWGAHCLSYITFREPYDFTLEMDHLCRIRSCVNPWHLEPVTRKVNNNRGLNRYNHPVNNPTCHNGHLRVENKTTAGGGCKACNAVTSRRYRARRT